MKRYINKTFSAVATVVFAVCMISVMAIFASASNEVWQMKSTSSLNVRKSATTSASVVTVIPAGTKYTVTAKSLSDSYVWGRVTYGGVTGWCSLNYSTYISGNLSIPVISNTAKSYSSSVPLKWSAVNTAKTYYVYVYKSDSTLYARYACTTLYKTLSLPQGSYKVIVTATNTLVPNWRAKSATYVFSVTQPLVGSIALSGSSGVVKGARITLRATVAPSTAVNKSVSWSSSNKNIATVSSSGVVTGVSYGRVVITCKANDASGKSTAKAISVTCAAPGAPSQVANYVNNTTSSVQVQWTKVAGATGYQLYKYNPSTKKYVYYCTTTTLTRTVTGLSAGSTVYFKVRAYVKTATGNVYTALSGFKTTAVLPLAPTGITATGSTVSSVSIKWNRVSGATSYAIYKYNYTKRAYVRLAIVTATSYTASATSGELCNFRIRAIKLLNSRSWCGAFSTVFRMSALPSAPALSVRKSGTSAILTWGAVNRATGYEVYYSTSASGGYRLISISDGSTRSLTRAGLTAGQTYYFRVRAYITTNNITGYGAYSSVKSIKI